MSAAGQERGFGLLVATAFAVGAWFAWRAGHGAYAAGLVALAATAAIIAIVAPATFAVPSRWWSSLGHGIGRMVNPIVIGAIFFLLITPLAIVLRIFGHDALRLRKRSVRSYWIERASDSATSFDQQF